MDELIRLSKKAANEWRNTDAYYQAAVLIDSLCDRLEKAENGNQQTNADRIRSMSDEELAEKLYCFTDIDCKIAYCKNLSECEKLLDAEDGIPEAKCKRCLLEWLKQPAEE